MAHYRTDDDIHRLAYKWYGPSLDGWLALIRVKGRTLTEWAILVPLFVAGMRFGGPLVAMFAPGEKGMLVHLIVRFSFAWFGAGAAAKVIYERFVDADRSPKYMVRVVGAELVRCVSARGPVDGAVAGLAFGVWLLLAVVMPRVGPRLVELAVFVWAAVWVSRWVVARVQSPERAWRLRHARMARAARFVTIEVTP